MESRFWISKDGEKVFGRGPMILLNKVDKLGSLNKAAKELNMSYSKAWSIINRAEKLLGYSLLKKEVGGIEGGGSQLTSEARALIEAYEKFLEEAEINIDNLYRKYFKDL